MESLRFKLRSQTTPVFQKLPESQETPKAEIFLNIPLSAPTPALFVQNPQLLVDLIDL